MLQKLSVTKNVTKWDDELLESSAFTNLMQSNANKDKIRDPLQRLSGRSHRVWQQTFLGSALSVLGFP